MKRFGGRRKECPAKEVLSRQVDGDLDSAASEALAEHLAGCEDCSNTLEELSRLKSHVSSLASVSEREPDFDRMWLEIERRLKSSQPASRPESARTAAWGRRPLRWPRLAAAAAALALVVGAVFVLLRPDGDRKEVAVPKPERPMSSEAPTTIAETEGGRQAQWGARLDRWFADSRLFLIEASVVCERAGGGEGCEGLQTRAGRLADEGAELAALLSGHPVPMEDVVVSEVVSALRYLATQPRSAALTDPAAQPLAEMAVDAVFDINTLDMYRRGIAHVGENNGL